MSEGGGAYPAEGESRGANVRGGRMFYLQLDTAWNLPAVIIHVLPFLPAAFLAEKSAFTVVGMIAYRRQGTDGTICAPLLRNITQALYHIFMPPPNVVWPEAYCFCPVRPCVRVCVPKHC